MYTIVSFSLSFFTLTSTADLHFEITTLLGLITLLKDGLLNTTSLRKGHLWVVTRSNNENVLQPGAEGVSLGILDGGNVETSLVLLNVHELSNTSNVMTLGEHDHGSELGLDDIRHLTSSNIDLDGIIGLDIWVGVTNGTSIMRNGNWDLTRRNLGLQNLAELVLLLLVRDAVKYETSLDIKEETEVIAALLELNDVHETGGVVVVGAYLAVDLDATFHADLDTLLAGEGVFELVAEDDGYGEALALLVWAGGGLWGPDAAHFAEVPVLWRVDALQVFLCSAYSPVGYSKHCVVLVLMLMLIVWWDVCKTHREVFQEGTKKKRKKWEERMYM